MDTIVLEPSLRLWFEQDATQDVRSVNDLVNEAVAQYLPSDNRPRSIAKSQPTRRCTRNWRTTTWGTGWLFTVRNWSTMTVIVLRFIAVSGTSMAAQAVLLRQVTVDPVEEVVAHTNYGEEYTIKVR